MSLCVYSTPPPPPSSPLTYRYCVLCTYIVLGRVLYNGKNAKKSFYFYFVRRSWSDIVSHNVIRTTRTAGGRRDPVRGSRERAEKRNRAPRSRHNGYTWRMTMTAMLLPLAEGAKRDDDTTMTMIIVIITILFGPPTDRFPFEFRKSGTHAALSARARVSDEKVPPLNFYNGNFNILLPPCGSLSFASPNTVYVVFVV